MNPFGVSEAKAQALRKRLNRVGIREEDLEESFIRSGGPGGQNVNKVATCVWLRLKETAPFLSSRSWLRHRASGLEVKVQRERSQAMNRFLARRLLAEKLETQILGRLSAERQRIAKIRRQKRRRSRRAKEKLLAAKRLHSIKKQLRARPGIDE